MMPTPSYLNFTQPLVMYDASTTREISATNPCKPTPLQGISFANCPLIAALASVAWVNRKFIIDNISGPDANGNYTFTFWYYMTSSAAAGATADPASSTCISVSLSGLLNTVDANNNPAGIKTYVTVAPQVLLDSNARLYNASGMFYGAGSGITNEIWPALFERAYGKFCFFVNGISPAAGALQCTKGNDAKGNTTYTITGPDPSYADLANLTMPQWGGNAGISLMYLTGRNCFQLSTTAASFTVPQYSRIPTNVNSTSLYTFIKGAFCAEARITVTYGVYKTRYPLVAWTSFSGSQYSATTIRAGHCYSVLGVFDSLNGSLNKKSYIILRDTFGLDPDASLTGVSPDGNGSWKYADARFPIGATTQYPVGTGVKFPQYLNLSQKDGIFGLDQSVFSTYFPSIGWAEGYI